MLVHDDVLEVRSSLLGLGVFMRRDIPCSTVLAEGWGLPAPRRSKHSIPIDVNAHLLVDPPLVYVNHSCDPNCGLLIDRTKEVLQLQALRSVREGAEVSIDYDTFEYEIEFMPEQCLCGSQNCRGRVRGFKHLPVSVANQLVKRHGHYVADYLRLEFAG